jgi:hypothetical protein
MLCCEGSRSGRVITQKLPVNVGGLHCADDDLPAGMSVYRNAVHDYGEDTESALGHMPADFDGDFEEVQSHLQAGKNSVTPLCLL